ncbi:protein gufA [candidate division BRC1 bacterium SM23_51]|nr:MAG: protein gufA [candidate division BRC1 bacterium SM23_51]
MILIGAIASLAAGLATGVGALPAAFLKRVSDRGLDAMLGFAAGVMLAATSFSLIVPSIEAGDNLWPGKGVWACVAGMILGAVFLDRADKCLPHEHFLTGHEGPSSSLRKVWLFVLAITLHNFPEGLAVGVGYGQDNLSNANSLAIGIGLQNMPEGLAVAVALLREKYTRAHALWIATLTGLVEPVGGLLGVSAVTVFQPILPFALAFAAGAMLFVISDEIIPETHSRGNERLATFGVIVGFLVMMSLDNFFG